MQEVLSRSLGHLARIQDPQALAVWLYTVTRNRCWRMRRKVASAPKHMLSLDDLMPDEAELGRLLQDAGESPEDNLIHASSTTYCIRQSCVSPFNCALFLCSTTWRS